MMKEITVVMPVYKVEKYVSECLDSIINQTFDCFECIIIDDCSPDNSMRLIEEKLAGYKGNISFRIVRNERNEGVSAARNKGIELSRGGYLFFIDSDDMLYENCLEKLWEETKRHPGIDYYRCGGYGVSLFYIAGFGKVELHCPGEESGWRSDAENFRFVGRSQKL